MQDTEFGDSAHEVHVRISHFQSHPDATVQANRLWHANVKWAFPKDSEAVDDLVRYGRSIGGRFTEITCLQP